MGFVSNSTATTLTAVAKPEHAAQNNTGCPIFQVFNSRRTNSCLQSSSASFRLNCSPIKAMAKAAETLSVPTGSGSSAAGSKQALISLSDKEDLAFLGNGLQELGYTIVSTGGTASAFESAGVSVTKVEELTSFPEMLDGRVKTLHPNIHGGILARRDQNHHMEALDKHGIGTFDVVVVNLYPFYDKVSSSKISFEDGIENIDIGGPAMIRAAAKNHKDVLVVVDSQDYPELLESLRGNKADEQFRRKLAWKAFQHVASYDSAVSEWLWKQTAGGISFAVFFMLNVTICSVDGFGKNVHLGN